jgi:ribosomal subunit interface protein
MHISIISTKLELTPSLKTFIEEKMNSCEGLVKRFEQNGELTLFFEIAHTTKHHKHGVVFRAEAMLHVPGKTIRVESTNADAHAAIDEVKDAMKRELAEHKDSIRKEGTRKRYNHFTIWTLSRMARGRFSPRKRSTRAGQNVR